MKSDAASDHTFPRRCGCRWGDGSRHLSCVRWGAVPCVPYLTPFDSFSHRKSIAILIGPEQQAQPAVVGPIPTVARREGEWSVYPPLSGTTHRGLTSVIDKTQNRSLENRDAPSVISKVGQAPKRLLAQLRRHRDLSGHGGVVRRPRAGLHAVVDVPEASLLHLA